MGYRFKCKAKVLNTREEGGKNKSGKNYCFVHSAQFRCQVKLLNTPTRDMNAYSCEQIFISPILFNAKYKTFFALFTFA